MMNAGVRLFNPDDIPEGYNRTPVVIRPGQPVPPGSIRLIPMETPPPQQPLQPLQPLPPLPPLPPPPPPPPAMFAPRPIFFNVGVPPPPPPPPPAPRFYRIIQRPPPIPRIVTTLEPRRPPVQFFKVTEAPKPAPPQEVIVMPAPKPKPAPEPERIIFMPAPKPKSPYPPKIVSPSYPPFEPSFEPAGCRVIVNPTTFRSTANIVELDENNEPLPPSRPPSPIPQENPGIYRVEVPLRSISPEPRRFYVPSSVSPQPGQVFEPPPQSRPVFVPPPQPRRVFAPSPPRQQVLRLSPQPQPQTNYVLPDRRPQIDPLGNKLKWW